MGTDRLRATKQNKQKTLIPMETGVRFYEVIKPRGTEPEITTEERQVSLWSMPQQMDVQCTQLFNSESLKKKKL